MIAKECTGKIFYKNGDFIPCVQFEPIVLQHGKPLYEVLRIINKKALFLEEHIERFNQSAHILGIDYPFDISVLKIAVHELCNQNDVAVGNIKMLLDRQSKDLYIYFIPHQYPSNEDYKNGVKVISRHLERENPMVKTVNLSLRQKTAQLIEKHRVYEVLLVDHNGEITEGSKTNIFFIKDNKVYTPPAEKVLGGITRKYVSDLCQQNQIGMVEEAIPYNSIADFETAFLSGTSPKILPICCIDQNTYNTNHPLLHLLMNAYDQAIQDNLEK